MDCNVCAVELCWEMNVRSLVLK